MEATKAKAVLFGILFFVILYAAGLLFIGNVIEALVVSVFALAILVVVAVAVYKMAKVVTKKVEETLQP